MYAKRTISLGSDIVDVMSAIGRPYTQLQHPQIEFYSQLLVIVSLNYGIYVQLLPRFNDNQCVCNHF